MATPKKKALGRGLSALLNQDERVDSSQLRSEPEITPGTVAEIPLSEIETNPFQPRTEFDEEALNELAGSIKVHGIIQPVTVRMTKEKTFHLISGERRFRASQLAGLETIPAFIRTADDQAMLEMALVENIQRENLNAMEVAVSYQRLMDECNLTQEELSKKISKGRATVTNFLRLLKLPADVQIAVRDKKISMGHARALITVDSQSRVKEILKLILDKGLSVRDVEKLAKVSKADANKVTKSKGSLKKAELSFEQQKHVLDLQRILDKPLQVKKTEKGTGRIIIDFDGDDDLTQILDLLNP